MRCASLKRLKKSSEDSNSLPKKTHKSEEQFVAAECPAAGQSTSMQDNGGSTSTRNRPKGNRFRRINIFGDGNCLFRAVSMYLYGEEEKHGVLRNRAVDHIGTHWDQFANYLLTDHSTDLNSYTAYMRRSGSFATSIEICALSAILGIRFVVHASPVHQNSKIITLHDLPIVITQQEDYSKSIYLLLIGHKLNGHFELLIPSDSDSDDDSSTLPNNDKPDEEPLILDLSLRSRNNPLPLKKV